MSPRASTSRCALPGLVPIAAIRPFLMATSATKPGRPLPSMTVPPLIFRSYVAMVWRYGESGTHDNFILSAPTSRSGAAIVARNYQVIDADGHVLEPVDLWKNYIDP